MYKISFSHQKMRAAGAKKLVFHAQTIIFSIQNHQLRYHNFKIFAAARRIFAPGGGYLGRVPQVVLVKVCVSVCLFARIFGEICYMAYAPASNADAIRFFSEVAQKRVR